MKIIGQIFQEENYDVFRRLPDNRDVLGRRLNKLIASISSRYILNPIVVNEKMEIIDGQGRFEAMKALNMPIDYIISHGATSDDCRRMNKYNTKWSTLDFAKSYAKTGNESYISLLNACKLTGYPISKTLRLSGHSAKCNEANKMTSFEKGELKFDETDVKTVLETKKAIDEIVEALQFTGRINDAFIISVKIARETKGYSHDRMLANCRKLRGSYTQMSRIGDQLKEFERIYNYKVKAGNRIYFSDYMRMRGANARDYESTYSEYNDTDISSLKEDM